MKKLFYLLLFVSIGVFSQTNEKITTQTTLEEYNYVTKGYKIQIESGLDMKAGYILKDITDFITTYTVDENKIHRKTTFKLLYRQNNDLPVAIMMITERKDNNYKEYFCIPSYNSDLWNTFSSDFSKSLKTEVAGLSSTEVQVLTAKYSYYFNSLKMLSYCLTTNNLKK